MKGRARDELMMCRVSPRISAQVICGCGGRPGEQLVHAMQLSQSVHHFVFVLYFWCTCNVVVGRGPQLNFCKGHY